MSRVFNLFPDVCIEGELPIEQNVSTKIKQGITEAKDTGTEIQVEKWIENY